MKKRLVYGALAAMMTAGAIVGACGGDDVFVPPPDAGADARADGTAGDAAHADVGVDANAEGGPACLGNGDAAVDGAGAANGMALVLGLHCANCHQATPADGGVTLSGHDTSILDGGAVFPPNLTPDPATGLGCWTDPQIANAILNGVDDQDASLCVMPRFATKGVDAAAAEDIVEFLRSLPVVVNQVPGTMCPTPPVDAGADAGFDGGSDAPADGAGD